MRKVFLFLMIAMTTCQSYAKQGICELYSKQQRSEFHFSKEVEEGEDIASYYIAKAGDYTAEMRLTSSNSVVNGMDYTMKLSSTAGFSLTKKGRLNDIPYDGAWFVFDLRKEDTSLWCQNILGMDK